MRSSPIISCGVAVLGLLGGCAVGPDYEKPVTAAPEAFAESGPWKVAAPADHLPKGEWWTLYGDATLNRLQQQAIEASPTLQGAVARRDQARAIARIDRAALYPQASVNAGAERSRTAPNARSQSPGYISETYSLPVDLSYEIDLWGRVRRLSESAGALVQASEADYNNVLLGLQTDVAAGYFSLRASEGEWRLVSRNRENRQRSLDIVRRRFDLGGTGELDVKLAETELAVAESDLLALEQDRAALRYALAVLCGQMPESFSLEETNSPLPAAPVIPTGLPSELVERRPDIATAERLLASANADIGVAKAAFFPAVTLFGSAGYQSSTLDTLTRWDNRQWAIGPGITLPIFQGGRNTANYRRAQAVHAEVLANYRQSVLNAFREVETSLSDLRRLSEREVVLQRAVASSSRAAELVSLRYKSGQVSYLDVTEAERSAIANERLAMQVRGRQLVASVALIKAIGGGW